MTAERDYRCRSLSKLNPEAWWKRGRSGCRLSRNPLNPPFFAFNSNPPFPFVRGASPVPLAVDSNVFIRLHALSNPLLPLAAPSSLPLPGQESNTWLILPTVTVRSRSSVDLD